MSTPQCGLFAEQSYSFNTRFGGENGTNPEELLAAAHAGSDLAWLNNIGL